MCECVPVCVHVPAHVLPFTYVYLCLLLLACVCLCLLVCTYVYVRVLVFAYAYACLFMSCFPVRVGQVYWCFFGGRQSPFATNSDQIALLVAAVCCRRLVNRNLGSLATKGDQI